MNCYVHNDRNAVGTCVHCGRFICSECKTEIVSKSYCKSCLNEVMSDKNKEIERAESKQQPMVFMNSSSSSASSVGRHALGPYPKQSLLVHIILFIFTMGIGNIVYFFHIRSKQRKWRQQ